MIADTCGLADNNTRTVVNKEIFTDRGAGINIDSGPAVGMLRHNSRNKRNILYIKFMSNPVYKNSIQSRIGEDDLFLALGRRVAVKTGLNIFQEQPLYVRQTSKEILTDFYSLNRKLLSTLILFILIHQSRFYLFFQHLINLCQRITNKILRRRVRNILRSKIPREHHTPQILDNSDNGPSVRQMFSRFYRK